ncbi:MAG: ABC transporter substrate-binding protein, partial [Candidatus Sericytochromatia bacterium]|nr:ABC transporter substrate-binding protein [Candidatus Sericytochromatia bacterium]
SFAVLSLFTLTMLGAEIQGCTSKIKDQKDLVFGKAKDAVTLDPADITDGESSGVSQNIFETLVRYKDETVDIEPALAESWTTSQDGLTWTFKLRKGVKFHDGTDFNAESVKFNYDRQMDKNNKFRFNGKFEYWNLFFPSITKIDAKDPETVVFTLKEKDPIFLANLAMFTMGIASPDSIKKFGKDIFKNPVGTGAFKFVEWSQNEKILLKANTEYWSDKPKIRNLIFKPIPDNSVRLLELEKGSIQGMDGINPDNLAKVEENKDLKVLTQPGMNVSYMSMNTEKKPMDNLKVRLAINYAINKDALVKAFYYNGKVGIAAKNPLPPVVWGYNDKIEPFKYDREKAKQLLKESGADLSKPIELWAPPPRPYMPQPQKVAEAIQADLKDVGLNSKIITYELGTYLNKIAKGEQDACLMGWIGDNGDPDNFLYVFFSSRNTIKGNASNYSFYKNAEMDKLLDGAKKEMDKKKRTDMYMKVQEIFHRDVPWVPLFHSTQIAIFRKNVMGYKLHPVGSKLFKNVYFDNGDNSSKKE